MTSASQLRAALKQHNPEFTETGIDNELAKYAGSELELLRVLQQKQQPGAREDSSDDTDGKGGGEERVKGVSLHKIRYRARQCRRSSLQQQC